MENNGHKAKKKYVAPKMEMLKMDCNPNFLLMASGESYGKEGNKDELIVFD